MATQISAADKLDSSQSRHRFYLLSTYTADKPIVNKQAFAEAYRKISAKGLIVYRNGQTYRILVPLKQIYRKDSANYTSTGQETLKDLSTFLAFYRAEFMQFAGIGFEEKVADDSMQADGKSGFKGDYKGYKKITTDLTRKPRHVSAKLVKLKQTASMVEALKQMDRRIANVGIAITDEMPEQQVFMHGVAEEAGARMTTAKSRMASLNLIIQEVLTGSEDIGLYKDGSVLIEFKKY